MTTNKKLLNGKWKFVLSERHNGTDWEPTDHVKGMTWEFQPHFLNESKTIGNIIESTPTDKPTELNYTINSSDGLLRIEVYKDPNTRILDEIDIYELTAITQSVNATTIIVELINQLRHPSPYLRYTLQQIIS